MIFRKIKTKITDLADFRALYAMLGYANFYGECLRIVMKKMSGSHNAENVKSVIEDIINEYELNKE